MTGTVDHHLNPTMMLTSVEKNFEDLMKEIQAMPNEIVVQISRVSFQSHCTPRVVEKELREDILVKTSKEK